MKKLILKNQLGITLAISELNPEQIFGTFMINNKEISSKHEINCNSIKISDSFYKLFFCIQWSDDNSLDTSYTIFNGELHLNKMSKAKLILDWFFVCNKLKENCKVGKTNLYNYSDYKTKIDYQSIPYVI